MPVERVAAAAGRMSCASPRLPCVRMLLRGIRYLTMHRHQRARQQVGSPAWRMTTASASGVNRYAAGPCAGTPPARTRCRSPASRRTSARRSAAAPSRIARRSGLPRPRLRWMFSISTVASSTRMPTASAIPPSVIVLSVWPSSLQDERSTSGSTAGSRRRRSACCRQLPRNSRIISAVSPAAIAASLSTPSTAARTKTDWSNSGRSCSPGGSEAWMSGQRRPAPARPRPAWRRRRS